jgi:hypothetical protein
MANYADLLRVETNPSGLCYQATLVFDGDATQDVSDCGAHNETSRIKPGHVVSLWAMPLGPGSVCAVVGRGTNVERACSHEQSNAVLVRFPKMG